MMSPPLAGFLCFIGAASRYVWRRAPGVCAGPRLLVPTGAQAFMSAPVARRGQAGYGRGEARGQAAGIGGGQPCSGERVL